MKSIKSNNIEIKFKASHWFNLSICICFNWVFNGYGYLKANSLFWHKPTFIKCVCVLNVKSYINKNDLKDKLFFKSTTGIYDNYLVKWNCLI